MNSNKEFLWDTVPNFFILGAAKCGTTAIARHIATHPAVYVRPEKEVQFFSNDENYKKGLQFLFDRYSRKSTPVAVRCDASPQYLYNSKVLGRLRDTYHQALDRCKFMVILRNPVERAYSAYWMAIRYGWENRSFDDAIKENLTANDELKYEDSGLFNIHSYIEGGRYYAQLKPWVDFLRRDQLLAVRHERLQNEPALLFHELQLFLGLEEPFCVSEGKRINAASTVRYKTILRMTEQRHFIKDLLKPFIPRDLRIKLRYALRAANLKPTQYEPMSDWAKTTLHDVYDKETRLLEGLLDWNLKDWVASK